MRAALEPARREGRVKVGGVCRDHAALPHLVTVRVSVRVRVNVRVS